MNTKPQKSSKLSKSRKIKKPSQKKAVPKVAQPFLEEEAPSLNESDQEFISEMMAEMDEEEMVPEEANSLEQEESPEKLVRQAGDMNVIEIDEEFILKMEERCKAKGGKALVRLGIQIFNSAFNEKEIAGDGGGVLRKYVIFDPALMNQFLNLYLGQIPKILAPVSFRFLNMILFY